MLDFFGLEGVPFTREVDTKHCFVYWSLREATARLMYTVQHRQVCLLTGEAGMGKTTVVRSLFYQLDTVRYRYEYLCDSSLTRFGVAAAGRSTEIKRRYQATMLDLYEQDKKIPLLSLMKSTVYLKP